jgi:2-polyprenyl-3-methyl-5-hydroxy-6-metoxy-1,4-benzoquinol methylase
MLVFETLNAYQRTSALRGAIELDLFTAIGEGNSSVSAIAARAGASEKGIRVLCDYLTILGFLQKRDMAYSLTPDSAAFLDRRSPAYIGSVAGFLGLAQKSGAFDDMAALARKGGTLLGEKGAIEDENPIWVEFARSMGAIMAMPADLIGRMVAAEPGPKRRVLDIAAGHGQFGIGVAKHNPDAHITALDWAPVLAVAKENAAKAGVADRHSTLAGSAFEVDFGSGYNVALLTNFLHHFDAPTCETLIRKIHAALAPGGIVVTLEFIPDDDRVSPPFHAGFSLTMLAMTPSGDAYTFRELDGMFRNAGFARNEMRPLAPMPHRVIVSYK